MNGESLLDKRGGTTLVLTNHHVVNREGVAQGLRPESAIIVFEAVDAKKSCSIDKIRWESPLHAFDGAILLLDGALFSLGFAPIAKTLPLTGQQTVSLVFVIGHPDGRGLEFSINDNELLDREEKKQCVTRVHYRAATEEGSSGSSVFNEGRLEVIAIHHGFNRSRLNGKEGGS